MSIKHLKHLHPARHDSLRKPPPAPAPAYDDADRDDDAWTPKHGEGSSGK